MGNDSSTASWAQGGLRRAVVLRTRGLARVTRNRLVDQQLRQLRALVRTMRTDGADVLYLGESSTFHIDPRDGDRRTLPDMVADFSGLAVARFWGPGFAPELWSEFIRIMGTLPARPRAVVVPVCIRTVAVHLRLHPVYAYPQSLARFRAIPTADTPIRPWGRPVRASDEAYAAFEALHVQTRWGGDLALAESRRHLRGARHRLDDAEFRRTMFDFFHGETLREDGPGALAWRAFGRALREYGVPVISHWTPVPVEQGEQLFPGEFRDQVERNWRVVEGALAEGAGPCYSPVPVQHFPDEDFIEPRDGTEHLNEVGRLKIAKAIATRLAELESSASVGIDANSSTGG